MIDPLIQKLQRYGALGDEEREFLESAPSQVREYAARETIVREGDTPSESCLLVSGFACRYRILPDGARQILSFQVAGDFVDLHSFVLERIDHNIGAVTDCAIAKVPHQKLRTISERYPRLNRALMWDLALDGAIFREWMVSMGRRSAREKIAHVLCELLLRLRSIGLAQENSYEFPPTQADLGDALGLSTVHVNRVLQELRAEGLVVLGGKVVTIPDLQKLKDVAGFEPAYLQVRGAPRE